MCGDSARLGEEGEWLGTAALWPPHRAAAMDAASPVLCLLCVPQHSGTHEFMKAPILCLRQECGWLECAGAPVTAPPPSLPPPPAGPAAVHAACTQFANGCLACSGSACTACIPGYRLAGGACQPVRTPPERLGIPMRDACCSCHSCRAAAADPAARTPCAPQPCHLPCSAPCATAGGAPPTSTFALCASMAMS